MAALSTKLLTEKTVSIFKYSVNLLRSFSVSAQQSSAAATTSPKISRRKKKKNLFEVAQFLPNWGIGYKMAKSHWKGVSYEITKINLYKDGRHGKAWGIVHKDGMPPADAPKKIGGVHKRCWKYIPERKQKTETNSKTEESQA